ncbi:MAG: YbaB/EbfC family nucleoid-associated protein [Planctomyces sp.]|jgi:DNA-binding YbaB/EbfC family protein
MFKGLGNLTGMMQQARELQERMAAIKEKISELRVEGIAGGQMVRCEITGDLRVASLSIDQSLIEMNDREMLEELVTSAINQGLQKARDESARQMAEVAGGVNIPGLQDALSKFGLGG